MKLTHLALANKEFTIVAMVLLLVYGMLGFMGMPRSEDPYIEPPQLQVVVILPGATPTDMENLVLDPVDDLVRDVDHVEHTDGWCRDGVAILQVHLEPGAEQSEVLTDVERSVAEASNEWPPGVLRSDVQAFNSFHVKSLQVALVSKDRPLQDVERYADRLENRLQQYGALSDIDLFGTRSEEVRIALDMEKMAARNLPLSQVVNALNSASANIPGGAVTSGDRKFNVLSTGDFESLHQIGRTAVGGTRWSPIYLDEIAELSFAPEDRSHVIRVNGDPAVLVTASMKRGRNVNRVMADIQPALDEFAASLPPDIQLVTVFDQSIAVKERISEFFKNLIGGIVLVGLVMFFALGWRPATIVMIAIPFSFTIAMGFIASGGYAIQQMTIAALIISLGLLVDNGIVVTENINTFMLKGLPLRRAAEEGTSQVGWAVVASTVTTVLAFVPLAMMQDVSGDFIRSMPISVMIILMCSLLVALTISPMMSTHILRPIRPEQQPAIVRQIKRFVDGPYAVALRFGLERRWLIIVIATLTLFGAIALFPFVGVSFFPKADKPVLMVDVNLPRGSSMDATDKVIHWVEDVCGEYDEIEMVSTNVGRGQPSIYYNLSSRAEASYYGQLYLTLRNDVRTEKLEAFANDLRFRFDNFPGAHIEVLELEQGPHSAAPIELRVFSEDRDALKRLADAVEAELRTTPGAININNPLASSAIDLKVDVKRDKAAMLGVPLHEIDQAVRTALAGWHAGEYRDREGREYPIVLRLPAGEDASVEDLSRIHLTSRNGKQIPLTLLADIRLEPSESIIQRRDGQRMVSVTAHTSGVPTAEVEAELRTRLDRIAFPVGARYEFGGESEARGESFSSMYRAVAVAVIGIFGTMVLMFRSFRQPIIIFAALPLAFIGSILALFVTGYTFSFTAFVGLTSLVGIVVNNSILLVDMTNQIRRSGVAMMDALMASGKSRFVPILLTTATTIGGLLPLTLRGGSMWGPMGWVIIGGLFTSTVLTLIVVPVLYSIFAEKELRVEE